MAETSLQSIEASFNARVLATIKEAQKLRYNPTLFVQMFDTHDGILGAVKHLLQPPAAQTYYGFQRLWELGRLDLTIEYLASHEDEFAPLFTDAERDTARERLRLHNFDDRA